MGQVDTSGTGNGSPDAGAGTQSAVLCHADLSVSGTFAPPAPPPADQGCVPLGTWTVTLGMSDTGDCSQVPLESSYVYQVTGDAQAGYVVTYPADPNDDHVLLKLTSEGGTCGGVFEHYAPDGKSLLLIRPYVSGTSLAGSAWYETYSASQI